MALSKKEAKDIAGDLYSLAEDILKLKARKKPLSKADLKAFRNRALQLAVKLTIDILD
jgi:hypothetical protein